MKQKLLAFLFMRFIPHRTAVGIALGGLSAAVDALNSPAFCADVPSICHALAKPALVVSGLLVAAGIRDKDRK